MSDESKEERVEVSSDIKAGIIISHPMFTSSCEELVEKIDEMEGVGIEESETGDSIRTRQWNIWVNNE
jgi:hypothetical protein